MPTDPQSATSSSLAVKDVMTWVLTAAALGWNYYNFDYAKRLRRDTFELDEWKLERAEVLRVVRAFEDEVDLLDSLSKGAHDLAGLREELSKLGPKVTVAHGKLVREIERSSVLRIPPGAAYGTVEGGESSWDRYNEAWADAEALEDANDLRLSLPKVAKKAREIGSIVTARIIASQSQMKSR